MSFFTEQIIYSKIYPPKSHDGLIPRYKLYDLLNSGLTKKLTYLSSPTGFGKTTLLITWIKEFKKEVAWVNLSEYDNDIKIFFKYLILSIQKNINSKFGINAIKETENSYFDTDRCITLLINDFIFFPNQYIIVIDNYHFIQDTRINKAISFIVNNLPDNVHLYISSKSKDSSINYSRLIAQNELVEIDTNNLKFSRDELKRFYHSKNMNITDKNIENIEEKTEGWILSIQLSSFFIKENNYDVFDNKLLIDYIFEEILEKISPEILSFLLKTSLLSKFNYEIANNVNEIENSVEIIEYLYKNNLFITPIDHKGEYYRFHNLFSDILIKKLRQSYSKEIELNLRRKAYDWYLDNKFINEALEQSFILEKEDKVLELLDNIIYSEQEISMNDYYLKYMNKVSVNKLVKYPKLCFSYLQYLIYTFKLEKSQEIITFIETNNYKIDPKLNSYILFSKAYKNFFEENIDQSFEYIKQCLDANKNKKDLFMLSNCYIALSSLYLRKSYFSESLSMMNKGLSLYKKAESMEMEITADMIFILITLNRFSEALEKCLYIEQNIEKIKFSFNYESIKVKYLLAQILIYFYQNKDFEYLVEKLLKFLKNNENMALLNYSYMSLANIYISLRKFDRAELFIESIEAIQNSNDSPDFIFLKARMNLYNGFADISRNMFSEFEENVEINSTPDFFMIIVHTYIVLKDLDKAKKLLESFFETHPEKENVYVIYNLIFKAVILQMENKPYLEQLINILKMTEKSNNINIFSDFSDEINLIINEMISEFHKKNRNVKNPVISNQYLEKILVNFYQKSKINIIEKEVHNINLTKREIELLDMLDKKLTNIEISDKLYVSINTTKTHIKNIFKKLGVKTREEAILKYKVISSI